MMKKLAISLLGGLLVLLLVAVYLHARGSGSKAKEKTELLWYGIGDEASDIPKVFGKVSEKLSNMGRDYAVKYERFGWGDFGQKLQLILASGERADIAFIASWAGNYYNTASSGYLTELEPLLEQQPKLKASLSKNFWDAARVSGKIYAVPTYKDMVYQDYAAFNKKLLEKHSIEIPAKLTWENVTPILAQMSLLEPDYAAYDGRGAWYIRGDYLLGPTVPVVLSFAEPDKGFRVLTEIPEFQNLARLMREWREKGYSDKDAYLREGTSNVLKNFFMRAYQSFPGEEVGMSKTWGPIKAVQINGPPVLDNTTPLGAMLSIPAASPNKEQAMDFIALVNTDPAIRTLVGYGIEGVHYTLDGNGQVARNEMGINNYNMPNFSLGSLLPLTPEAGEPLDVREQLKKFNEEAQASPALGFAIDTEKYRQIIAQVSATSEPYLNSARYGLKPAEETLAEWRAKLRELGWFEVVAEINAAYMEWKKAK